MEGKLLLVPGLDFAKEGWKEDQTPSKSDRESAPELPEQQMRKLQVSPAITRAAFG
jgi:hypothetical protein